MNALALKSDLDGVVTPLPPELSIGRGEDCGLCIRQDSISRQHASITLRGGQYFLHDPGSRNGTFVNGLRIGTDPVALKPRDLLRFDNVGFSVVSDDETGSTRAERDMRTSAMAAVTPQAIAAALGGVVPAVPARADTTPAEAAVVAPAASASAPEPASAAPVPAAPAPVVPAAVAPAPAPAAPVPAAPARSAPMGDIPASWAESGRLEARSHTMAISAPLLRALSQPKSGTSGVIAAVRAGVHTPIPYLVGLNHGIVGQMFHLHGPDGRSKWEIGRDAGSDVLIADDSVSGRHAQVVLEGGRWKIVNLMSINGTFVNGRKVLSAHLHTGDKIGIGNIELAFDAGDNAVPRNAPVANTQASGHAPVGIWQRLLNLFRRRR